MGRESKKSGKTGSSHANMSSLPRISAYQKLHGTQSSASQRADKMVEPVAEKAHIPQTATSMLHPSTKKASSPLETASPTSRTFDEENITSKEDAAHNQARTLTHSPTPKPTPSPEKIQLKYPPGFEIRSSQTPNSFGELEETPMPSIERDDESVEETITTDAARLAFPSGGKLPLPLETSSRSSMSDGSGSLNSREEAVAGYSDWEGSDDDLTSEDTVTEPEKPLLVPGWFPKNIKKVYETDHHGGALFFKELNEITRYRAALEIIRRHKWKKYIEAGHARMMLQKVIHKLRVRPLTKKFYAHRKMQYRFWKDKALERWKRLEKIHRGVLVLDELISTNFEMERIIYKKKLDGVSD